MNPVLHRKLRSKRDTRFSFLTAAAVWLLTIWMSVPGNLDYSGSATDVGDANPIGRSITVVIFIIGIFIILNRLQLARRLLGQVNIFFLLFVALATASILWSIDPSQTARRLQRMAAICVPVLAVGIAAWHPSRFQHLLRAALTALLVGSIVFCLVRPDLALHHGPDPNLLNAWHGLFLTKNSLATAASFAFILWAHAWLAKDTSRMRSLLGCCAAGICLIMSRGSTSIIATVLTVSALLLLMRAPGSMRRSMPYLATGLIVIVLIYSLAMLKVVPGLEFLLAPIPMITGKDLTFSNRTAIWAAVMDHIRLRPLLGSGYGGYWTVGAPTPDMESYALIARLQGFYPGSAHNGYLQILNDLGVVGLICLLGYLLVHLRQSIRLYAIDRSQGALFLALLLQQSILNLEEPLWLNVLLIDFMLMTLATICLARALLDTEARTRSAVPHPQTGVPRPPQRRARSITGVQRLRAPRG
jgi:exopolysaccharide production protein ExoQ